MARTAFCTTCSRTVYVDMDDSLICPACSSPILEAINAEDEPKLEATGDKPAQSERK